MKSRNPNSKDNINLEQEISIPDYVSLRQKYNCDKCKLNRRNAEYCYRFPQRLKYIFSTCYGVPCKRTQCKKRCWFFSDLFSVLTAAIIVIAFIGAFSYFQDLLLTLAYTILFAVGMDIICCFIEYAVDKIFENIEKFRRKRYDNKVADIDAINQERIREAEKQKERENAIYKDINDAKDLFSSFSNDYLDKINEVYNNSEEWKKLNKELLKVYKEFLNNLESLLKHITLDNFYFSEIKMLFQIHLPKLKEYLTLYIESAEKNKETDIQIIELTKLLASFNIRIIRIKENLNSSEAESLIYKMQALREVVSHNSKEDIK